VSTLKGVLVSVALPIQFEFVLDDVGDFAKVWMGHSCISASTLMLVDLKLIRIWIS